MAEPKNLRLSRPYGSVEDYVAAEGWTIDARGMLLVDQKPMKQGSDVRFEIVLRSGDKPIRAEGRVVGYVEPTAGRPGGVRVKFRRLGPNCKSFIERVLEARGLAANAMVEEPTPPPMQRPSLAELTPSPFSIPVMSERAEDRARNPSPGPIAAPPNREELLDRLRERARRGR